MKRPVPRVFQEPKRHYSEKVIPHAAPHSESGSDESEGIEKAQTTTTLAGSSAKSATQFYKAQLHRPSGVSTPPPMSYPSYIQPVPPEGFPPNLRASSYTASHYSTNTLPQVAEYIHGFQQLHLGDPNVQAPSAHQQQPYLQPQYVQTPAGFYPVYYSGQLPGVVYAAPAPPPSLSLHPGAAPFTPTKGSGLKKKPLARPSQFRPPESFEPPEHGEHKAANEEYILSVIQGFLEHGSDISILKGKVVTLALTQTGSRFLQKQLTKANPGFVAFVLEEVEKVLPDLMVDDYGNYFCQRLVSSCSPPQRIAFLSKVLAFFQVV